jgi:DNA-3-methyladenine glycosylase
MPTPRTADQFTRGEALSVDAFRGQAREVAPDLLGTLLVVETEEGPVGGLVIETEAYVNGVDPASHLAAGRTPRTASFFGGPGNVYVYTIHGHHALNIISVSNGYPEGILIRALEPTHGLDCMVDRRGFDDPVKLASGPGKLTEALGITTETFDDRPLAETPLSIYETDLDPAVTVSGRIGVSKAADWPLRFTITDNAFVSQPVSTDGPLDHDAVDRCYDRLAGSHVDAHALTD